MEHKFYITRVDTSGAGRIVLLPYGRMSKVLANRTNQMVLSTEKITISFPNPPKVKMTLEEVCTELGKDIEIVGKKKI